MCVSFFLLLMLTNGLPSGASFRLQAVDGNKGSPIAFFEKAMDGLALLAELVSVDGLLSCAASFAYVSDLWESMSSASMADLAFMFRSRMADSRSS